MRTTFAINLHSIYINLLFLYIDTDNVRFKFFGVISMINISLYILDTCVDNQVRHSIIFY